MRYFGEALRKRTAARLLSAHCSCFFFDYDGTLSPIQTRPRLAVPDSSVRLALEALSRRPRVHVVLVTGRRLEEIRDLLPLEKAVYAGNHGFEIQGPEYSYVYPRTEFFRGALRDAAEVLLPLTRKYPGTFVEDKRITLTYHYRLLRSGVPDLRWDLLKALSPWIRERTLKIHRAKKSFEIRPHVRWDKGSAVRWILLKECPDARAIYIGDDKTDESAFKALRGRAITVRVGRSGVSNAQYYVDSVDEVHDFLRILNAFPQRVSVRPATRPAA